MHLQSEAEPVVVQVEAQNGVETGGCEEQTAIEDRDLMAVFQIRTAVGIEQFEGRCVNEQLIAGRDKDPFAGKGDTP